MVPTKGANGCLLAFGLGLCRTHRESAPEGRGVSSKRRIRRKACKGKIRHPSRAEAQVQMREAIRARRAGGYLNVYPCPFCRGFHVGHKPGTLPSAPALLRASGRS